MGKREEIEQLKGAVLTLTQRVDTLSTQVTQLLTEAAKKKVIVPEVSWEGGKVTDGYRTSPDIKHFEQKAHQPKIRDLTKKDVAPQTERVYAELQKKGPKPFAHPRRGVGG